MLRKKSAFSLIEILITFILASILFGCIFMNFSQTVKLESQMEKAHHLALQRESMQLHLQSLLSQLPLPDGVAEEKGKTLGNGEMEKSPLYIAEFPRERTKALWFNLTVDYSDDRRFMGPLTYCLYHDEKNHALQLLTRSPHGDEKTEKILCDVKGWELSLFDPKKKVWTATWPQNMHHLPLCLKLQIFEKEKGKKKEGIEFAFTLPAASQAVIYP